MIKRSGSAESKQPLWPATPQAPMYKALMRLAVMTLRKTRTMLLVEVTDNNPGDEIDEMQVTTDIAAKMPLMAAVAIQRTNRTCLPGSAYSWSSSFDHVERLKTQTRDFTCRSIVNIKLNETILRTRLAHLCRERPLVNVCPNTINGGPICTQRTPA